MFHNNNSASKWLLWCESPLNRESYKTLKVSPQGDDQEGARGIRQCVCLRIFSFLRFYRLLRGQLCGKWKTKRASHLPALNVIYLDCAKLCGRLFGQNSNLTFKTTLLEEYYWMQLGILTCKVVMWQLSTLQLCPGLLVLNPILSQPACLSGWASTYDQKVSVWFTVRVHARIVGLIPSVGPVRVSRR